MGIFDIICLVLLVYGAVRGVMRGLVLEVSSLVGLFLGLYVTIYHSYIVSSLLKAWFDFSDDYVTYVAKLLTFVIVIILIHLLGSVITKVIKIAALGLVNRVFGLLFGLIKFGLILCVIAFFFNKINTSTGLVNQEKLDNAIMYRPLLGVAEHIYNMVFD